MFAFQRQANGTIDQVILVLIRPWRLHPSSKFTTFGASLVNDNGERCLIFNMQNGGNATANPQRTFPSSCTAAAPAAADSAWRPCHLASLLPLASCPAWKHTTPATHRPSASSLISTGTSPLQIFLPQTSK